MILIFFHLFTGPQFCQQDRHYEYLYFFPGDGGRGEGVDREQRIKGPRPNKLQVVLFFLKGKWHDTVDYCDYSR